MNEKVNKKELEAKIRDYKRELEELQNQVAAQEAEGVLKQIMDGVMENTSLCQAIGNLSKDKCRVYIRHVVEMYEVAYAECGPEFDALEKKKEEKAARRKNRAAKLQTAQVEQSEPQAEQNVPEQEIDPDNARTMLDGREHWNNRGRNQMLLRSCRFRIWQ